VWTLERLRTAGGLLLVATLVVGSGMMPSRQVVLHWLADRWLPLLIALLSAALAAFGAL